MTALQAALINLALLCWSGWHIVNREVYAASSIESAEEMRDLGMPRFATFLERSIPVMLYFDCFNVVINAMSLAVLIVGWILI